MDVGERIGKDWHAIRAAWRVHVVWAIFWITALFVAMYWLFGEAINYYRGQLEMVEAQRDALLTDSSQDLRIDLDAANLAAVNDLQRAQLGSLASREGAVQIAGVFSAWGWNRARIFVEIDPDKIPGLNESNRIALACRASDDSVDFFDDPNLHYSDWYPVETTADRLELIVGDDLGNAIDEAGGWFCALAFGVVNEDDEITEFSRLLGVGQNVGHSNQVADSSIRVTTNSDPVFSAGLVLLLILSLIGLGLRTRRIADLFDPFLQGKMAAQVAKLRRIMGRYEGRQNRQ